MFLGKQLLWIKVTFILLLYFVFFFFKQQSANAVTDKFETYGQRQSIVFAIRALGTNKSKNCFNHNHYNVLKCGWCINCFIFH